MTSTALDPSLRSPKERPLFILGVAFSALVWLALLISLVGAFYGVIFGVTVWLAHAVFLASLRGNGIRVSEKQLPHVHERLKVAAQRLGLSALPELYLVESGGLLNALATRFLSRHFVVLYSSLLDRCEDPKQLEFVLGHELGHLASGHLQWQVFLAPFRVLPWFGPAYSRACEYTADRCGLHATGGELEASRRGLVLLAGGGRHTPQIDLEAFDAQAHEAGGFWMSIAELVSSHPFLSKRSQALREFTAPGSTLTVSRHPLAYPLAPFFGFSAGGSASLAMVVVVYMGVLAAIAIPNFIKFQERARAQAAVSQTSQQTP